MYVWRPCIKDAIDLGEVIGLSILSFEVCVLIILWGNAVGKMLQISIITSAFT